MRVVICINQNTFYYNKREDGHTERLYSNIAVSPDKFRTYKYGPFGRRRPVSIFGAKKSRIFAGLHTVQKGGLFKPLKTGV